jgi:MFS family permease
VIVLAAAVLVYTMLETMLTPALPLIQEGLGTTTAAVAWVLTGVLLSGTVCTPLVGRLADLHDKRPILLVVMLVVCAGTLLSAVSGTIFWLAVGQILQGAGLALVPLALGILRDTQSARVVTKASGLLVGASALSVTLGLILTGIIVSTLRYNWLFWIPFALLVAVTVVAWFVVPSCPPDKDKKGTVDWLGAGVLAAALLALLLGVSFVPSWGWASPAFAALEVVAVILLVAFVIIERRSSQPLVDLRLGGRPVVAACVMTFVVGFVTTASFVVIPTIVSAPAVVGYGLGAAASVTGIILIPGGLVGAIAATLVSRLERLVGARAVMVAAGLVLVVSAALLLFASSNFVILLISSTLLGVGIGLGMTQSMNLVVASVPPERIASVSGLTYVLRSVGGTIGGQIAGSILTLDLVVGTHFSTWSAISATFWIGLGVALVVTVLSLALPARVAVSAEAPTAY